MTRRSIERRVIALAGAVWLWGCSSTAVNEPPPQTPSAEETAADAGLPAVPLTGKGVVVPSDVKLQPGPKAAVPPSDPASPIASPGAN
jgi:hypothetical protein